MKCSGLLLKTNWFPQTNLVSSQETPVLTNFYLQPTKYISLLMTGLKWKVFFLISQKHLIRFGTRGIIFKLNQTGISGKLLNVLSNFLKHRKQRVTLNGQVSSWTCINAGFSQRLILGSLLFLAFINDLADGLSSNAKLFADNASLFSVIHNVDTSANELNNDLYQINKWAFQWNMSFNPDPSKQAQ